MLILNVAFAAALVSPMAPERVTPDARERWTEIAPPARADHVTVFDPGQGRLILFGGQVAGTPRGDLWVLDREPGGLWQRVSTTGEAPPPLVGACAILDAARDRALIFGGCDATGRARNELWELRLRGRLRWRRIEDTGPAPDARCHATLTLLPGTGTAILYGGARALDDGAARLGDAWQLDLRRSAWRRLESPGASPAPRSGHTAVFCSDLGGLLVFGGDTLLASRYHPPGPPDPTSELWLRTPGASPAWQRLRADTTAYGGACPVAGHAAFWDAVGHRMWVTSIGGLGASRCLQVEGDLRVLDVRTMRWSSFSPWTVRPRGRAYAAATFDEAGQRLILHGGETNAFSGGAYADTWILHAGAPPGWERWSPEVEEAPSLLQYGQAVYDASRDVVWAGTPGALESYDVVTGRWHLDPAANHPAGFLGSVPLALDPANDQLVACPGPGLWDGNSSPTADDWLCDLAHGNSWSKLAISGDQPPVIGLSETFDTRRHQLVVWSQGSPTDLATGRSGLWTLPLGTGRAPIWRHVTPVSDPGAPRPDSLGNSTLVYDAERDRLLLFGGARRIGDGTAPSNGCWALSMAGDPHWAVLSAPRAPASDVPSPRFGAAGAIDPATGELLVLGGPRTLAGPGPDDAWAFDTEDLEWRPLDTPGVSCPRWTRALAAVDTRRGRTLVFQDDAVWSLELAPDPRSNPHRGAEPLAHGRATAHAGVFALRGVPPSPSRATDRIAFALPDAARGTLALFDVTGRRIWIREVFGSGIHEVAIGNGRSLAPGLYFARLEQGERRATTRIVVLP